MDAITVHRIVTGPLEANCYLIASRGRDAVVIDPGDEAESIAGHIAADDLRLRAVLGTHAHHDHLGAAAELLEAHGVPFCLHSGERNILKRLNFFRFMLHGLGPIEVPEIDLDLAAVTELRFGDLEITVEHTPGHSPGSVCFVIEEMLFTGDTLMATGKGNAAVPGGDPEKLDASIRRLSQNYRSDMAIHPGHGEPGRLGDAVSAVATTLREHK